MPDGSPIDLKARLNDRGIGSEGMLNKKAHDGLLYGHGRTAGIVDQHPWETVAKGQPTSSLGGPTCL